jgi:hypothetical protein
VEVLYAVTMAIGPSCERSFCSAKSAALTAASIPGDWFALTTAEVGVSRSIVGFAAPGDGAISDGLYILTRPWLLPQSSAAVMISCGGRTALVVRVVDHESQGVRCERDRTAWSAASSASQPILRIAAAVFD